MSETEAAELSVTIFAAMNVLVGAEAQLYAAVAVAQTNAKPESTPEPELERVTTALFHATRVAHAACEAALTGVEPMYDADLRLRLHETEEYAGCKTEVASALENASTIATALEYASTQYAGWWMLRSISYELLCDDDAMSEAIKTDNIGKVALCVVLLQESRIRPSPRCQFFHILSAKTLNMRVLRMLLSSPAHANTTYNHRKHTFIMCAVRFGHAEAVRALLSHPMIAESANAVNETGATALMMAAERGHAEAIHVLLTHPAVIASASVADKHGNTALMLAAGNGQPEAIRALLACPSAVASASVADEYGNTALMLASTGRRCAEAVTALLACPDIVATSRATNREGNTALMIASYQGRVETVNALLACPAVTESVNCVNFRGCTALDMAVSRNNCFVVSALLAFSEVRASASAFLLDQHGLF